MTTKTIATYDFDMDAMGLGPFVSDVIDNLPDSECVVYVEDSDGRAAVSASFVRETLTDGSTVVNLVFRFAE